MSEFVHPATEYEIVEAESPELMGRNLRAGAHLLASATAFFFLAFFFAYFYLRSLNNAGLWHPKGVQVAQAFGALIMVLTVGSAVAVRLGLADHRAGRRPQWRVKGAAALGLGVAALVLQVFEWTSLGFGPADGGFASVFFGWTAFQFLFSVGALFWLENILATSLRYGRIPSGAPSPGQASGDRHRTGHDIADPLSLVGAGLEAVSFYWSFLVGLGVVMWVVLYLI